MTLEQLLQAAQEKGISLWLEGDRLRYKAPPEAVGPELLEELRRQKEALVDFLKQAAAVVSPQGRRIPRREASATAPASAAQQRLWFLARLEPESTAYSIPESFSLRGALDVRALEAALSCILSRHDALRTTLFLEGGALRQRIMPVGGFTLPVIRLGCGALPGPAGGAAGQIARWEKEPFDLEAGPLFRVRLLEVGADEHILFLSFHHAIADGWSLQVFNRELSAAYAALRRGEASALGEPPVQYADFAQWQENQLSGPEMAGHASFWRKALSGAPPQLALPHDPPPPLHATDPGPNPFLTLSPQVWGRLERLVQESEATPFVVLLAAFQVLLGRLAGVEDLVIGTPVAGRQQPEVQATIGLFLNNLALRGNLSGNPSFRTLIRRAKSALLDAFAHQDLPFDRLVAELNPDRNLAHAPVFQILINQFETLEGSIQLDGVESRLLPPAGGSSKYDLTLYVNPGATGARLEFAYDRRLFAPERAREMLRQLGALVEQLTAAPDRPVNEASLAPDSPSSPLPDPRVVLDYPPQPTVLEQFTRLAREHPDAPALIQGKRTWSYGQLLGAVERVGGRLAGSQAAVVAVSGPSAPALVAAALGVWRAGGILLLVDPKLPARRQELMAEEARITHWMDIGPGDADAPGIQLPATVVRLRLPLDVDELPEAPAARAPDNADAYLVFTSGTTGKPKAVLGTHQGLAHFLGWQRTEFKIGPGDRVAQLTGLSFDVVFRDLFLALTSGAAICLPNPGSDLAADCVLPWLELHRVSVLHIVPSLASAWLIDGRPPSLAAMRWVFFAGEPLTDGLVRRWRAAFPRSTGVVNLYGPTETTLAKCGFEVPDPPLPGVQPVGAPMPHTQILILNPAHRLCGVGEAGEITIRTPYRTRGYLRDPEQTARRFLPNPFRNDPEDLVYLTGDRGRYRLDGGVEILGRTDRQVKVRGVRIELDEVNAALATCPGVTGSAVIAGRDSTGEIRLIAYLASAPAGRARVLQGAREHLVRILPGAYVPSAFVGLDQLPLTANGKLNASALPPPEDADTTAPPPAGPANPVEQAIAEIWGRLLPGAQLDTAASFFDLGGHSLLALRLLAELRRTFGRDIPLRHLFLDPTIAGLARAVAETPAKTVELPSWCQSLTPLQPGGSRPPLFVVPGGNGGDWELYVHGQMAVQRLGLDQPAYGIRARGWDGKAPPHTRFDELIRDTVAEIRQVQPHGPYFFLGDCLGGYVAFGLACALQAEGEEVPLVVLADCAVPQIGDYWRFWWRSRFRRFRQSLVGRVLFNVPRLAAAATPSGRRWLRRKVEAKLNPEPALFYGEYWSAVGEKYRRTLGQCRPGMYRGRLHLLACELNAEHPRLLAWGRHATEGAERHVFPGDHWSYLWTGAVEIAALCRSEIDRFLARSGANPPAPGAAAPTSPARSVKNQSEPG